MRCTVYRSPLREYTYLYLADGREWDDLPEDLRARFGAPEEVMSLDLRATTRLARVDIEAVRAALEREGHYLQFPPGHSLEDEIETGLTGRPRR